MALPPLVPVGAELDRAQMERYARHVLIPAVGLAGQRRLSAASVLVVGAGGLGSAALLYLAAAGVGTLGVVDADRVDVSNLQRQVLHGTSDVGRLKTDSAREAIARVNPLIRVVTHDVRLDSANALQICEGYDLVVDGSDNFPTRYLVSDACVLLGKPHVWGSIFRFDGQASVWWARHGPCYRCVFPQPPPPGLVPSCAEGGVLGVLCGAVGSVQGTEAVKLLLGIGEPLLGRLLVHDALRQSWDCLTVAKDPGCPACGTRPTITSLIDYDDFCGMPAAHLPGAGGHAGVVPAEVTATQLRDLLEQRARGERDFVLVDVRGPQERSIAAIPGAMSIHLDLFRSGEAMQRLARDVPVVLHCKSGARSAEAAELLVAAGYRDVRHLGGGVLAWVRQVDPEQPLY